MKPTTAIHPYSFIRLPLVLLALLAIPFIAMLVTDEVTWSAFDFLVMGILLFTIGIIISTILHFVQIRLYRLLFIGLAMLAFLLIWLELAVGLFGTAFAGS